MTHTNDTLKNDLDRVLKAFATVHDYDSGVCDRLRAAITNENTLILEKLLEIDRLKDEIMAIRGMFLRAVDIPFSEDSAYGYDYSLKRHPFANKEIEALKRGDPINGLLKRLFKESDKT